MNFDRGRTFVMEDEKDDYVLLQELLDKGWSALSQFYGLLTDCVEVTSEREGSPVSQINPDGTRTRFQKREGMDEESGSLSPPPLSICKRTEDLENIRSIADFLNESRLSPGEAETLKFEIEYAKLTQVSPSKENTRPGHESRIGSIRRKVSSVLTNFTITPPRSEVTSESSSFSAGTPTKVVPVKCGPYNIDDLNQKTHNKDRTLSTASTLKVETPQRLPNDQDDFISIPYEFTSPLHPDPMTDRSPRGRRHKPLLSLNTHMSPVSGPTGVSEEGNTAPAGRLNKAADDGIVDDPFSTPAIKSPPRTHPLITASNSWAKEMNAIAEGHSSHVTLSAPPSVRSSYRKCDDSHITAMTKHYAQEAQALTARNGKEEVFGADHPAVKKIERKLKARVHGTECPHGSNIQSLTFDTCTHHRSVPYGEDSKIAVSVHRGVASFEFESAGNVLLGTGRPSDSGALEKKLSTSTVASDTSNDTSFLLVSPAASEACTISPVCSKAKESYEFCCRGFQPETLCSDSPQSRTPAEIVDPHYEPRAVHKHFSFLKKPKNQGALETGREKTVKERITELRERTETEVIHYQPTDERCRHPNHNRTWYSKK